MVVKGKIPFKHNPIIDSMKLSSLNSVTKKDVSERKVIFDLRFPKDSVVYYFISKDFYLGELTDLRFGISEDC